MFNTPPWATDKGNLQWLRNQTCSKSVNDLLLLISCLNKLLLGYFICILTFHKPTLQFNTVELFYRAPQTTNMFKPMEVLYEHNISSPGRLGGLTEEVWDGQVREKKDTSLTKNTAPLKPMNVSKLWMYIHWKLLICQQMDSFLTGVWVVLSEWDPLWERPLPWVWVCLKWSLSKKIHVPLESGGRGEEKNDENAMDSTGAPQHRTSLGFFSSWLLGVYMGDTAKIIWRHFTQ